MSSLCLEIAVASLDDALTAFAGGADRLELNAALALGGLTPSLGMLAAIKRALPLPVLAMIRPRPGGFCYGNADFTVMQLDIDLALSQRADGIVFGVLHSDGTIDTERCRQLVQQISGREVVFHRAFDVTPDQFTALEQLIDLGVRRVMTSGQQASAQQGAARIADLIERAAGRIEILPAGGINRLTVADVVSRTNCNQIHASLRCRRPDSSIAAAPHVSFGKACPQPEDFFETTDRAALAELKRLLVELCA